MRYDDLIQKLETRHLWDKNMSSNTNDLLQEAATALRDIRTELDNQHTQIVDLRARLECARKKAALGQ